MLKSTLLCFVLVLGLTSCDKGSPQVDDPFKPVAPPTTGGDIDDNDDLNPAPTPTPDPLPTAVVLIEPSDVNPDDIILTYKKRKARPLPLGESKDEKECHPQFKHYCMVDGQVLFQFPLEDLNTRYPKEIWAVTNVTLRSDFYSLRYDDLADIICISNSRLCSGVSLKNHRERKFWRNDVTDYLKSNHFSEGITRGLTFDDLKIVKDFKIILTRFFSLTSPELQTLIRKNNDLIFNVAKDIYVDSPQLKIELKRRVPRSTN